MKTVVIVDYFGKKRFVPVEDSVYEVMTGPEFNEEAQDRRHERHKAREAGGEYADPEAYAAAENLEGLADVVIEQEEKRALYDAIEKLSPIQRKRVYMYMKNMNYSQIARAEGCSVRATCDSLLIAFKKLRLMLAEWY